MMPMASPVTAIAVTSISRLLHSGMKANTTEMMNVDAARDDKEEQSLEGEKMDSVQVMAEIC